MIVSSVGTIFALSYTKSAFGTFPSYPGCPTNWPYFASERCRQVCQL